MKIIISHDVDHLYASDHFKDLIFPKLWIRSTYQLLCHKTNLSSWYHRLVSIFHNRLNRLPELIQYNQDNKIPSVFFFGMDNALGLSYDKGKAMRWIKFVMENGFDVGVHGINFTNVAKMRNEFHEFKKMSNLETFGIRMHYVRKDFKTLSNLANIGYLFDSTEFNKKKVVFKRPYKIEEMWEFPLYIMDGYIMQYGLENAKVETLKNLQIADKMGMPYFTILFHDYLFNQSTYPDYKKWYTWLINYLVEQDYSFTTYRKAIIELEMGIN